MDSDDARSPFHWDNGNVGHLDDLEPEEIEAAMLDPARISANAYNVQGERRWAMVGATEAGNILFVVYTYRGSHIRVVTARDATDAEKRRYRQRGK